MFRYLKGTLELWLIVLYVGFLAWTPEYWYVLIKDAERPGMPASLIAAVIDIESLGNPYAQNRFSGAIGLMQIYPMSGRPETSTLRDPEMNIRWGVRIYIDALERCRTTSRALAAYVGGTDRYCNPTDVGHWYADRVLDLQKTYLWMD